MSEGQAPAQADEVCVLTGWPRSHVKVGDLIAHALGAKRCHNPLECTPCRRVIYFDNLNWQTAPLVSFLGPERVVLYLVAEGPSTVDLSTAQSYVLHHVRGVASPSKFSAQFIEEALRKVNRGVDMIIPHGIVIPPVRRPFSEKKGMLYRAYYMKRKFPGYGIVGLLRFHKLHPDYPIDVITYGAPMDLLYILQTVKFARVEPNLTDAQMMELYDAHAFWLNLSDCEGFGLMPVEAMSFGEVVIAPRIPTIEETVPSSSNFLFPVDGTWDEPWGYLFIRHHKYDPDDLVEAMEKAITTPLAQLEDYSQKNIEHAKSYDYMKVYQRFLELL